MLTTGVGVGTTVQNLEFDWDKSANLKVRRDNQANKREEFDYDGLYRLSQIRLYATVGGGTAAQTDNHTYDTIGNLTNKGGSSGSYTYSGYNYGTRTGCTDAVVRPHAVYQVNAAGTTRRYCYDGNGNLAAVSKTSGSGPIIYDATSWWVANLAKRISQGGTAVYSDFWYGPGRERIQQTAKKNASVTETTLYVGGAYEKVTRGATVEHVHYVRGGGDVAAIQKKTVGVGIETRYLHRDHLGSVVAATDAAGAVLERYSFDAWGKRRDPASWLTPAVGTFAHDPAFNDRGYTGHEHIDHLGLVNMNGRVYDPEVGRFLSADPFVQFPQSTQGYNRFTYVGNNPLSYADPSGFFWKSLMKVVGFIMSVWMPQFAFLWQQMLWAFAAGTLASGGDFKAGALNAITLGMSKLAGVTGSSLFEAAVQGGVSAASGGKFKEGFRSSLASTFLRAKFKGFGGDAGTGNPGDAIKRVVRDAVIGGAQSELGGGKFQNGALTGSFDAIATQVVTGQVDETNLNELPKVTPEFYDEGGNPLASYDTHAEALQAGENASRAARAASGMKVEYGVATIKIGPKYLNSNTVTSFSDRGINWIIKPEFVPDLVSLNHLHTDKRGFSDYDVGAFHQLRKSSPKFEGVYMFDDRGNHWYGPSRPGSGPFRTRQHSCGGASASAWICPIPIGKGWKP